MLDSVRALFGSPPPGYEVVEYIIVAVIFLLFVRVATDVFFAIFRRVTNG